MAVLRTWGFSNAFCALQVAEGSSHLYPFHSKAGINFGVCTVQVWPSVLSGRSPCGEVTGSLVCRGGTCQTLSAHAETK